MTQQLNNYLRMHRRRSGFSLEELGFLLGHRSGSAAGKHERFRRLPTVTSVFAYEIVFQRPARDLFGGLYQRIERDTIRRALELAEHLTDQPGTVRMGLKSEALKAIYLPFTEQTNGGHDDEG